MVYAQAEATKLCTERVLELLAALRPEVRGSWAPEALSAALRPDGVTPGQVWIGNANLRGHRLEQISDALDACPIEV